MHRKDILALVGFYIPCLVIQYLGGLVTMPQTQIGGWYQMLWKSELTPPGYVFGIVWTILYAMMAVAAWRVWRKQRTVKSNAQRMWLVQLLTGFIWTCVFFGMRMTHEGLAIIACLVLAVALTLRRFYVVDRLAAGLMLPLLLWVSFATYLNATIVALN